MGEGPMLRILPMATAAKVNTVNECMAMIWVFVYS